MALNVSHSNDMRGVVIYNGEYILLYSKHVNMTFDKISSGDNRFKGKKTGKLYLTSHRVIFVNDDLKDGMLSFAMPFHCMDRVKLEQPLLGANYLEGFVEAQPNGNWEGTAVFKLTFDKGGCIDFGKGLLRAHHAARQQASFNAPPPYQMPPPNYFQPPPTYYAPPDTPVYKGYSEAQRAFPEQPDPGMVYMYDAPPPYPGVAPQQQQPPYPFAAAMPQPQQNGHGAYSKEQEAMGQNRNTAGAEQHPVASAPPPSYYDATKPQ